MLDFAHVQMTGVYTAASCTSPPPSSCLFFRCQIWGVALVFATRLKPVAFTCPSFKVKSHTLLLWQRCSNSQKRNSLLIKNYNISFCILPTIVYILILFNVYIYLTCLFTRLHMYLYLRIWGKTSHFQTRCQHLKCILWPQKKKIKKIAKQRKSLNPSFSPPLLHLKKEDSNWKLK